MEVVALGLFTFNLRGLDGAMFQMLSHGFVSVALFPCVGVLYGREDTHEIATFGAPHQSHAALRVFMAFAIAGMGLPATSSFVCGFLVLTRTLHVNFGSRH